MKSSIDLNSDLDIISPWLYVESRLKRVGGDLQRTEQDFRVQGRDILVTVVYNCEIIMSI